MSFAKHETFHLREGWLYKGMNAIMVGPDSLLKDNDSFGVFTGPGSGQTGL